MGFVEWPEMEGFGEGGGDAGGVGFSAGGEALEDEISAGGGALWVAQGVEAGWCLRQASEQGALGKREVGKGFLEVEARGFSGPDAEVAVIETVEVGGEDL